MTGLYAIRTVAERRYWHGTLLGAWTENPRTTFQSKEEADRIVESWPLSVKRTVEVVEVHDRRRPDDHLGAERE